MNIVLMKPARKFIKQQPRFQQERLLNAITRLPLVGDVKPLKGLAHTFRLRVGDFRVIYSFESETLTVLTVGNRGDVY